MKYYVVWKGRKTGIFISWDECREAVTGFPGAKFKSFPTKEEAETAFQSGWEPYIEQEAKKGNRTSSAASGDDYIADSISVDAASSGNPGAMEYQGVCTKTGKRLFHFGPVTGTNNIGEFLAIVHALVYLKEKNSDLPVYSDSATAIKWVKMKKANTTLPETKETEPVWNLIRRAEEWLENHTYPNKILKWDTKRWGENKADFGRK